MDFNYIKDIEYAKNILDLTENEMLNLLGVSRMTYYRWIHNVTKLNNNNLEIFFYLNIF